MMMEKKIGIVKVELGDMIDHIYNGMIERGFAPTDEGIYEVIMLQSEYLMERFEEDETDNDNSFSGEGTGEENPGQCGESELDITESREE